VRRRQPRRRGSCSDDCKQVTSQRAVGFILAVSGAQLDTGDQFTLDDGINPPVVFRFEEGGLAQPPPPLPPVTIPIVFLNTDTLNTVQLNIKDAITAAHDAQQLLIQVDVIDAVSVRLVHDASQIVFGMRARRSSRSAHTRRAGEPKGMAESTTQT